MCVIVMVVGHLTGRNHIANNIMKGICISEMTELGGG